MAASLERFDVIVAGGGVAGIAAAVTLAEHGARVALIEARPYLGGRVRSFHHSSTGDEIDNGQHLMMGAYTSTFQLLRLLGTHRFVEVQSTLHVEFREPDGIADHFTAPSFLPGSLALATATARLRPFQWSDARGLLRLGRAIREPLDPSLTVSNLLLRCEVSPHIVNALWRPLTIATLNTLPEQASARLFASVLRLGFLGPRAHARLALPQAPLSHLFNPAADFIHKRGGVVRTSTTVQRIEQQGTDTVVMMRDGGVTRATQVIVALPLPSISRTVEPALVPAPIAALAAAYHPSPIVSGYLWFDQPLERVPQFCALRRSTTEWVFNRRRIDPAPPPRSAPSGLLSVTISAADAETGWNDSQLLAHVEGELRNWLPEMKDARMAEGIVIREKRATFRATPEFEQLREDWGRERCSPGISFAGDWDNTGLPGTIEGAARSGIRQAQAVIKTREMGDNPRWR